MDADIAHTAALFADPTRAHLIGILMAGSAHTPTELAQACGVAPSTMSGHLDLLTDTGVLSCTIQGRHRYYRLTDHKVASAYEALSIASDPLPLVSLRGVSQHEALRSARSCYDHLAGRAGTQLLDGLLTAGHLTSTVDGLALTTSGTDALTTMTIVVMPGRRRFAYGCLDWTERRYHLAGALGAAILGHALEAGWYVRRPGDRALTVTLIGVAGIARLIHATPRCSVDPQHQK